MQNCVIVRDGSRTESGNEFHSDGPETEKLLSVGRPMISAKPFPQRSIPMHHICTAMETGLCHRSSLFVYHQLTMSRRHIVNWPSYSYFKSVCTTCQVTPSKTPFRDKIFSTKPRPKSALILMVSSIVLMLLSDVCLTSVCLSRTSGLSREQRGLGRPKLA